MLGKLASSFTNAIENKAITVPISASIFNTLIEKYPIEAINNASVAIQDGLLVVSGTTSVKKLGFKKELDFTISLKPVSANNRTLELELVSLKPLDFNKINQKLLQRPPVITYNNRLLSIDLNAIDAVKKVPFGQIKNFTVEESELLVTLGL